MDFVFGFMPNQHGELVEFTVGGAPGIIDSAIIATQDLMNEMIEARAAIFPPEQFPAKDTRVELLLDARET